MAPVSLWYVSALHGYAARSPAPGFRYLELGCGGGVSLVTLAAANPDGEFWGVDLNAQHVAYARDLAARGGVTNLEVIECNFRDLERRRLPLFDFVVLHGVYAWVSEEVRQVLVGTLARLVAPGGVALVSYNAMPGSSVVQPLREMLIRHSQAMPGADTRDRLRAGIEYMRFLSDRGAGFFADNPSVQRAVASIADSELDYLVHEFLNPCWTPLYFAQVAEELSAADLTFAGSLPVGQNYIDFAIPKSFQEFFRTVHDRNSIEVHRGFVLNERFRRDVYVRATAPPLPEPERNRLLDGLVVGTASASPTAEVTLRAGTQETKLSYSGELFEGLRERIVRGAASIDDLCQLAACGSQSRDHVIDAVNMLLAGGQFRPFRVRVPPPTAAPHAPGGWRVASPFNRNVLTFGPMGESSGAVLAAAVSGDGVAVGLVDALLLLAVDAAGLAGAISWCRERLAREEQWLVHDGVRIESAADQQRVLATELAELLATRVSKYFELGIVERLT